MSTDIVMVFHCLLTQICINIEVIELPGIDLFFRMNSITNLGLIIDIANLIYRAAILGAT